MTRWGKRDSHRKAGKRLVRSLETVLGFDQTPAHHRSMISGSSHPLRYQIDLSSNLRR
jgi:hypothetical protein